MFILLNGSADVYASGTELSPGLGFWVWGLGSLVRFRILMVEDFRVWGFRVLGFRVEAWRFWPMSCSRMSLPAGETTQTITC